MFVSVTGYGEETFVGQVQRIDTETSDMGERTYRYYVKFMRPYLNRTNEYIFPNVDDYDYISTQNISKVLPQPIIHRGRYIF